MHRNFGEFAISSVTDAIASTLNKNSYPSGNPSLFPSPNGGRLTQGSATVRLALSDPAFSMPQPGEIWQLCRSVKSPLPLSDEEQRSHYPDAVLRFLAGKTPPRYVMVVTEPELSSNDEWQMVSVMMLSVKTEHMSTVDLVIPAELSGVGHDLLAETWHIQRGLVCNLSPIGGHRLSRQIYDLLMSVGDRHYNLIDQAPTQAELQSAGLQVGLLSANDPSIQQFHQQEREWSSILNLPVAAYRAFCKSMQLTSRVLEEALLTSHEMALDSGEQSIPEPYATHPTSAQGPTVLSQWFEQLFSVDWETIPHPHYPGWAIALKGTSPAHELTELDAIETLILQLNTTTDEIKRRQLVRSLGDLEISHPTAVQTLAHLVQTTTDNEMLWAAVESLWKLDPTHPAAGVRRVKRINLEPHTGQTVALAIALSRRANQHVAILLRVVPGEHQPTLSAGLTLTLHDLAGTIVRKATAKQSDGYIQITFNSIAGEAFSVSIAIGDTRIVEKFVL
jgi:hypothetical protein